MGLLCEEVKRGIGIIGIEHGVWVGRVLCWGVIWGFGVWSFGDWHTAQRG